MTIRKIPVLLGAMLAVVSAPYAARAESASAASYCVQEISAEELGRMRVAKQQYLGGWFGASSIETAVFTVLSDGFTKVEIENRSFRVVDPPGVVTELTRLNSGDDYNGWRAIHELSDGWLYVRGAQYDHAVRIEQRGGRWSMTRNIRVQDRDKGLFGAALRWLFGVDKSMAEGYGLTSLVAKGDSRFYSSSLRSMLFTEDGEKFEKGYFLPAGLGTVRGYYGDLVTKQVVLFRSVGGRVHSYDEHTVAPLEGPRVQEVGWMFHPVPGSRAFLGSGSKVFEIRGPGHGSLRFVELSPTDGGAIGLFSPAVSIQGKILFVGRYAIYEAAGDELRPIWQPDSGVIWGPADANRLADGKLVIIIGKDFSRPSRSMHLLGLCHHH